MLDYRLRNQVVRSFQQHVMSLRPENAIFSQSGLANNWAMGFASCRSDGGEGRDGTEGGLFDRCMEGMRKEAERSCWLNSIVVTHSLAGGTGSGLGAGLLQVCVTTNHRAKHRQRLAESNKRGSNEELNRFRPYRELKYHCRDVLGDDAPTRGMGSPSYRRQDTQRSPAFDCTERPKTFSGPPRRIPISIPDIDLRGTLPEGRHAATALQLRPVSPSSPSVRRRSDLPWKRRPAPRG